MDVIDLTQSSEEAAIRQLKKQKKPRTKRTKKEEHDTDSDDDLNIGMNTFLGLPEVSVSTNSASCNFMDDALDDVVDVPLRRCRSLDDDWIQPNTKRQRQEVTIIDDDDDRDDFTFESSVSTEKEEVMGLCTGVAPLASTSSSVKWG